jgi:hypothetical protein
MVDITNTGATLITYIITRIIIIIVIIIIMLSY